MKSLRLCCLLSFALVSARAQTIVGWNNLGMHCMDADYSVFSILPPYNTIHAQVIGANGLLTNVTVTYEALADPTGSINTTSAGKTEFWQFLPALFGLTLPVDVGLPVPGPASFAMPGVGKQTMEFSGDWFAAYGIPITPYDDAHQKNPYPLMRLVSSTGAKTDIVLPVSDEMDCSACHASGSGKAAMPAGGWVNDPNPQRDYRLNILRLHDEKAGTGLFTNQPVLCASCHRSEALPGSGQPGIAPLTRSMHDFHAHVIDPTNGMTLDASGNRSACYRCHPGSATRCLRGAMGSAVAPDGSMAMQCQSCHGNMAAVGAATRTGWLDEPSCQQCHVGAVRRTTVGAPGDLRFATEPNTLYRFSKGHGGLYCEACHGSTHAEFPSSHDNDNLASIQHQGHVGMLVECQTCHNPVPDTVAGGPHGLHPVGQSWVNRHPGVVESSGAAQCKVCHGNDYRGTFLSRSQADRTISAFGTKKFWRGFQIGCYTCHNGPGSESGNPNRPPVASPASVVTPTNTPVAVALHASDPDGNALTLRVVAQARHGTVGLAGTAATYFPEAGFGGVDSFTFAAWDGQTDSNLGKVMVGVGRDVPPLEVTGRWVDLVQVCRSRCKLKGHFMVENAGGVMLPAGVGDVYLSADSTWDPSDLLLRQVRFGTIPAGQSQTKKVKVTLPAGVSAQGKYILVTINANVVAVFGPVL